MSSLRATGNVGEVIVLDGVGGSEKSLSWTVCVPMSCIGAIDDPSTPGDKVRGEVVDFGVLGLTELRNEGEVWLRSLVGR